MKWSRMEQAARRKRNGIAEGFLQAGEDLRGHQR